MLALGGPMGLPTPSACEEEVRERLPGDPAGGGAAPKLATAADCAARVAPGLKLVPGSSLIPGWKAWAPCCCVG